MFTKTECIVNMKELLPNGDIKITSVDFTKLPCSKCERYGHLTCPKGDCWNKDGKYCLY